MTEPAQPSPRGTVLRLNVLIHSIDHKAQRYDTCGDYYSAPYWPGGKGPVEDALYLNVSQLPDFNEMLLVAIHELIEWALCQAKGVSNEEIDSFDFNYVNVKDAPNEPGDCPAAPYYTQHQIATGIERILAAEMGVDWTTYERHIEELGR